MKETKFVNILELNDELREKVRRWRNKERIRKCMLTQHTITKEEHHKWIESLTHGSNWKFWVIFAEEIPIGSAYLQNINHEELTSEWGFYIGEDSYRGKGLSKCILAKLLKLFFEEMRFEVLFTKVLSGNIPALNLYRKFRFREIDRLPLNSKGKVVLLEFSKKDWIDFREQLLEK